MWKVQRFASFQNSFFVFSMLLNDPVTSDIDLVYTFPRGLKHLEWVYNKTSSRFSSFPTKISSLYFLVHFFGILSSLASGHDATIHFLIFCYVNLIEYFEKSGDPESKLFSMLLIVRENTVNNVLFAKPSLPKPHPGHFPSLHTGIRWRCWFLAWMQLMTYSSPKPHPGLFPGLHTGICLCCWLLEWMHLMTYSSPNPHPGDLDILSTSNHLCCWMLGWKLATCYPPNIYWGCEPHRRANQFSVFVISTYNQADRWMKFRH